MKRNSELSVVNREQIEKLLATLSKRSNIGIRNTALIILLARTGLRISEALSLKIAWVDFDARTIRIPDSKSSRPHTVGASALVLASLQRWMDRRRFILRIDDRIPVFCGTNGRPLSGSAVRESLKRLAKRAGIEERLNPHGFRRGFIGRLSAAGVPLSVISQAVNHASPLTTLIYLQRTGLGNESVAVLQEFDWDRAAQ